MPTTSTFDSTGLRGFGSTGWPGSGSISSSAGWNCQPRTVLLIASVNGGVARSVLTALTTPLLLTVSSKNVSPPPMARIGICGSAPSRYRAGTNPLCASATTAPYTMIGHAHFATGVSASPLQNEPPRRFLRSIAEEVPSRLDAENLAFTT